MSRVSVTEQAKLSLFLARAILRALLGQFAAFWIYRLPLFSGKNDRLVIAPQDLRTADATQAAEIHSGRFVFAGFRLLGPFPLGFIGRFIKAINDVPFP